MKTLKLKKLIEDLNNGVIYNDNPSFVSLIIVEDLLKRKNQEFLDKTKEYIDYLGRKLKIKIYKFNLGQLLYISGTDKKRNDHNIKIFLRTRTIEWQMNNVFDKWLNTEAIENDTRTKEYLDYAHNFMNNYFISKSYINSNLSLSVLIEFDFKRLKIFVSDDEKVGESCPSLFSDDWSKQIKAIIERNFYYYKESLSTKREIVFNNEEVKTFLNEEIIGKIYAALKIDISAFPRKLQEEIRQAEISLKAELSEKENAEMLATKELQVERIMKAYALIKEATELLSLAKSDIGMEKIKLDNINSILFKNNGVPNSLGYIEFEEFFKNNMVLRMLDLSKLDLTNVDIRGMDFSGTNIHIDPQKIYNKDMSYVNATDVKFSPFFDSFHDVILDGTIINDYEANINLSLVRSYNEDTHLSKDVVMVLART